MISLGSELSGTDAQDNDHPTHVDTVFIPNTSPLAAALLPDPDREEDGSSSIASHDDDIVTTSSNDSDTESDRTETGDMRASHAESRSVADTESGDEGEPGPYAVDGDDGSHDGIGHHGNGEDSDDESIYPPVMADPDSMSVIHPIGRRGRSPTPSLDWSAPSITSVGTIRRVVHVSELPASSGVAINNGSSPNDHRGHVHQESVSSWIDLAEEAGQDGAASVLSAQNGLARMQFGRRNLSLPSLLTNARQSEDTTAHSNGARQSPPSLTGGSPDKLAPSKPLPRPKTLHRLVTASKSFTRLSKAEDTQQHSLPKAPQGIASDEKFGKRHLGSWFGGQSKMHQPVSAKASSMAIRTGASVLHRKGKGRCTEDGRSLPIEDVVPPPLDIGLSPSTVIPTPSDTTSPHLVARPQVTKLELPDGTLFTEIRQWYVPRSSGGRDIDAPPSTYANYRGEVPGRFNRSIAPQLNPFPFQVYDHDGSEEAGPSSGQ